MTLFNLEKLLDKFSNKYKITVIAARRARVLTEKSLEFDVKSSFKKATSIGLEEALNDKVKYLEDVKKKSK